MRAWAPVIFMCFPCSALRLPCWRIGPEIEKTPRVGGRKARVAMWARAYVTSTRISGRWLRACMRSPLWHARPPRTSPGGPGGRLPEGVLSVTTRRPCPAEQGRQRRGPHAGEDPVLDRRRVRMEAAVGLRRRLPGGGAALDSAGSASCGQSMRSILTSTTMVSPSATRAIGPPSSASGATWPITSPTDPPENRASVMRAMVMWRWRHSAVIREVGSSSSGMPGRAPGSLVADDHHVVVLERVRVRSRASIRGRSPLKTRARPVKTPSFTPPSTPATLRMRPRRGQVAAAAGAARRCP